MPPESESDPHPLNQYVSTLTQISANYECDSAGNSDAECCKPGTKPAYLQFKLPVSYALTASGDRYSAFKKIERCRLSYGRTTARTVNKVNNVSIEKYL